MNHRALIWFALMGAERGANIPPIAAGQQPAAQEQGALQPHPHLSDYSYLTKRRNQPSRCMVSQHKMRR